MVTQELVKPSLTREIRGQFHLNQQRGDARSYGGWNWATYGESVHGYDGSFRRVLKGKTIGEVVRFKEAPIVVDLMSPSDAIVTLFARLPSKQKKFGLAVSLEDLRNDGQRNRDERLNVAQIEGDVMRASTWQDIEKKLQGRKADLIMERAYAGFQCIPKDPRLYAMLLNRAWALLSPDNGVFLFQTPWKTSMENAGIDCLQWVSNLRKKGISAEIDGFTYEIYYFIKLVKTKKSPEKLPFLSVKQ